MSDSEADVMVIGGGPAGLSASVYLARYARSVLVIDGGQGRSTHHQVNHNYLGFPGGVSARRLRQLGREQLGEYPQVVCRDEQVDALVQENDGFTAHMPSGRVTAPAVILCTGVLDNYPQFPGWEDYVGRNMFWCITCDGYSNRDRRMVALGNTDSAALEALQLQRFSNSIAILTGSSANNQISPQVRGRLTDAGIAVIEDEIAEVEGEDGSFRCLTTEKGRRVDLDVLFSLQGARPRSDLARQIGVGRSDAGWIEVDSDQKTDVAGVFAAGDVTRLHAHQVSTAVHEGAQAACAANHYLYPPELR